MILPGSQLHDPRLQGFQGIEAGFKRLVESFKTVLNIRDFSIKGIDSSREFPGHPVHIFSQQRDELSNCLLIEDALPNLRYYKVLQLVRVEVARGAGACAVVVQRTTDVVVVLSALRGLTNISAAADAAAKQPTEKVCAPDDSRPLLFRCTGLECLLDLTEGLTGNDGWPCVFGADGIGLLSYTAGASPNRCARVDLIAEDVADARLEPSLSAVRDAATVEFHADFLESVAAQ